MIGMVVEVLGEIDEVGEIRCLGFPILVLRLRASLLCSCVFWDYVRFDVLVCA